MDEIEPDVTSDDSTEVLLGKKLRLLRESRGYSIEDVAGQLYLDCSSIIALESGDYSKIPSKSYIKGYIRNFVKLFDAVSEFDSFKLFDSDNVTIENTIKSAVPKKTYVSGEKNNKTKLNIGILILLIIGVYVFVSEFEIPGGLNIELPNFSELLNSEKNKLNENSLAKNTVDPEPVKIQYQLNNSSEVKSNKVKDKQNSSSIISLNDNDTISLNFINDSWTQVKDAEGKELISRYVKSGKKLKFNGKLPFTITLGNSRAVYISVNGHEFSQSKYTGKELSHFVINANNLKKQVE